MGFPSGEVAIVGVYESPRRKAPGVHPFAIQAECILGALADAGPRARRRRRVRDRGGVPVRGRPADDVCEVAEYMGIHPRWFDSTDIGGAAFITHAGHAALAIAAGMADVVVVSYAAAGYSGIPDPVRRLRHQQRRARASSRFPTARRRSSTYALAATRHMHEFGTTPRAAGADRRAVPRQCRAQPATRASATRSPSPTCSPRR